MSEQRLPDFLGIGAPKCATTWLFEALRQHPGVFMPARKEVNYLHYGDAKERFGEYVAHFVAARPDQLVGEFSTRYLQSVPSVARAKELIPDAKLIVSLRNPADQVWSHYWHFRRQNFHQTKPVERDVSLSDALVEFSDILLGSAKYSTGLQRWLSAYPIDRVHCVRFEDVATKPTKTLRELFAFLGVDAGSAVSGGQVARKGTSPKSDSHEKIQRRLYALLAHGPYRWLKSTLGVERAETLKERLKVRHLFEWVFARRGYREMTLQERRLVWGALADEPELVESLLGMEFPDWRRDRDQVLR
ncbi:MAG: sulfotransferase [Lysobacteraceae bacterium]|nr:MAG: sulfotransferase [Xanthomonadaceae bacterium]